jgi:hypothetical protein
MDAVTVPLALAPAVDRNVAVVPVSVVVAEIPLLPQVTGPARRTALPWES